MPFLNLHLDFDMPQTIQEIQSPTHPNLEILSDKNKASVSLKEKITGGDIVMDIILTQEKPSSHVNLLLNQSLFILYS